MSYDNASHNSQLPLIPGDDGWGDAAGDTGERLIKGQLIKFADWRWTIGKEREEVAPGRRFEALATAACWQHWKDQDETEWEFFGADPQDPWRNTRLVYLLDPRTMEDFTFSTSSYGGRAAVSDLGEQITRMRLVHADAVPIVELSAMEMPTKYGPKSKPVFKVVSWKTRDTEHVIEREINPRQAKKLVDESNDPDDSIPF